MKKLKTKEDIIPKSKTLSPHLTFIKNLYHSLYTYLSTHLPITTTSLTIYLYYSYYTKGCFELTCYISENEISSTKLVKGEVVVTNILGVGLIVHFWRILVFCY